jgi:hypothetical protein
MLNLTSLNGFFKISYKNHDICPRDETITIYINAVQKNQ